MLKLMAKVHKTRVNDIVRSVYGERAYNGYRVAIATVMVSLQIDAKKLFVKCIDFDVNVEDL